MPAVLQAHAGAAVRSFDRINARCLCTNSGNAYSLTYDVPPVAYEIGEFFSFFVSATNTGAATLNINGMGAKALVVTDGSALKAGDITAGMPVTATYNGTHFRLVSTAGKVLSADGAGSGLDADLLDGQHGAWYQSRANHTGTQDVATITGLQALLDAIVPAATVIYVASAAAPSGYLAANGANVSRTTYSRLFTSIGTTYGAGNGSTTFTLPDLRGVLIRGLDSGRSIDDGRTLGSFQDSMNLAHNHGISDPGHGHSGYTDSQGNHSHSINDPGHVHSAAVAASATVYTGSGFSNPGTRASSSNTGSKTTGITINAGGAHTHNVGIYGATTGISVLNNGGAESRPKNVALLPCIKY
ncbi:phage tail protein [Rhizobium mongolense]|uniref:Microcystin-dependent protein n=1 Tax=Rhizobium mongolense TaxID=57676 RepID=A0ABR6IQ52_9HYPH|nr:tail fiber protein [Rhizobium mongolense]MBB4230021.1 microcystin-dependent protein [Rhizobium mongolense]